MLEKNSSSCSLGQYLYHRNIVVEDPRPTLQQFFILMEGTEPWAGCGDARRGPGDLYGVTFKVWHHSTQHLHPWLVCFALFWAFSLVHSWIYDRTSQSLRGAPSTSRMFCGGWRTGSFMTSPSTMWWLRERRLKASISSTTMSLCCPWLCHNTEITT